MARVAGAAAVLLLGLGCTPAGPPIEISTVWGFAPPGPTEAGVYFTVTNRGTSDDTLTRAAAAGAAGAMLHRTVPAGGMMTMEQVHHLVIPAGGVVRLEPGALHLMLTDLSRVPVPGDTLSLTLTFARAGPRTIPVPFVAYGDQPDAP